MFRLRRLFGLSGVFGLAGFVCVACGQKGPPLAPIVYLPRPVTELVVKRSENDIVLRFTVPTLNTDGSGFAVLQSLVYSTTGGYIYAGLAQGADGTLYGKAHQGGNLGYGTVFKLNPDGTGFAVLESPFFTSRRTRSTQRLEYPHSLSYHERTLTKSPSITLV